MNLLPMNNAKILGLLMLSFVWACNEKPKQQIQLKSSQETLIRVNKKLVEQEEEAIQQWLKRHQIKAENTGSGLYYCAVKKGYGMKAQKGHVALINYRISLLDGTLCYSADSLGYKEFLIGEDHVESGLHEGILRMRVGEKAIMILPPHLAHGLIGDSKKVPPMSTIIYEVELKALK